MFFMEILRSVGGKIMQRTRLEKATLVAGAAAREKLASGFIPRAPA